MLRHDTEDHRDEHGVQHVRGPLLGLHVVGRAKAFVDDSENHRRKVAAQGDAVVQPCFGWAPISDEKPGHGEHQSKNEERLMEATPQQVDPADGLHELQDFLEGVVGLLGFLCAFRASRDPAVRSSRKCHQCSLHLLVSFPLLGV